MRKPNNSLDPNWKDYLAIKRGDALEKMGTPAQTEASATYNANMMAKCLAAVDWKRVPYGQWPESVKLEKGRKDAERKARYYDKSDEYSAGDERINKGPVIQRARA
jgi:hypothetical protein